MLVKSSTVIRIKKCEENNKKGIKTRRIFHADFKSGEKVGKMFLSSRKYDQGCSSRIRILTFYPSQNSDPGVILDLDPQNWLR
jgi:hypothetical protein